MIRTTGEGRRCMVICQSCGATGVILDVEDAEGGPVLERGMVNGTMLVDRKRGWLTESWFNIIFNSIQSLPPSTGLLSLRMMTRITQHMHTFERR